MRIIALPRYDEMGASSRLRTYQYVPYLRSQGVEVDVCPLLDDGYVQRLYSGTVSRRRVLSSYLRRIGKLAGARRYDAIWLEKETLPWIPAVFELGLIPSGIPYAVDYDDAVFHRYDRHRSAFVRLLFGTKVDRVMRAAGVVFAGNQYLAQRARTAGCPRVEFIPTVIDLDRYQAPAEQSHRALPVIGWIGSPSTAHYLKIISPAIEQLSRSYAFDCVAIGAREDQTQGTRFRAVPWSEDSEVEKLRAFDIGVMPLVDEPWELGKCGYKLIQYMACAKPVVASPVGVNADLVIAGRNGFLASSQSDWVEALSRLLEDSALRTSMGAYGRGDVERVYSLQAQAPLLLRNLEMLVVRRASRQAGPE